MFVLTTENNRYVFTGFCPFETPQWSRCDSGTYYQPVVFLYRHLAEQVRGKLPQPLSDKVEVEAIITPWEL